MMVLNCGCKLLCYSTLVYGPIAIKLSPIISFMYALHSFYKFYNNLQVLQSLGEILFEHQKLRASRACVIPVSPELVFFIPNMCSTIVFRLVVRKSNRFKVCTLIFHWIYFFKSLHNNLHNTDNQPEIDGSMCMSQTSIQYGTSRFRTGIILLL